MPRSLYALLALLCFFSRVAPCADAPITPPSYGISRIVVQHTACYGACPVDSLTLNSDGSATYANFLRGKAPERGFFRGTLDKEKFAAMADFLQHLNFFALHSEMGLGNADLPDFVVSVTRNGKNYGVAFRGDNTVLGIQKRVEATIAIADQIKWQRDERAGDSGIVGWTARPLTAGEAHDFRNDKPPTTSLPLRFARVQLNSLDHPGQVLVSRSDQEGKFQFFAVPGRYLLTVSSLNASPSLDEQVPIYEAQQTVEIKTGPFKDVSLNTREVILQPLKSK